MSTIWASIEPYIQLLMKNSDLGSLDETRTTQSDVAVRRRSKGNYERKVFPLAVAEMAPAADAAINDTSYGRLSTQTPDTGESAMTDEGDDSDSKTLASEHSRKDEHRQSIHVSPVETPHRNHTRQQKADEIKLRYIAGKAAGRDVVDRRGVVIIKQGDILTAENIHLADEAGKLAELIVHMVIDDLGE